MTEPNLYNVGYDVGFEDGLKEAQARVNELEDTLRKLEYWFDTEADLLEAMTGDARADHMRKLKLIRDTLTGGNDE